MTDIEVVDFMQETYEFGDRTRKRYENNLRHYCRYTKMSLQELIDEAEEEADLNIRMRKREITKKLLGFKKHLKKKEYQPSTVKTILGHVKSFYRAYEIDLPKIKNPTVKKTETILDVITIDHIKTAVTNTPYLKHKALILLMASSGMGSAEALSLTVNDFINATKDYHNETDINNVLNVLNKNKTIIPCFNMIRGKTNYEYYTFCSPEACKAIIDFLKSRNDLTNESSIFDLKECSVMRIFERMNDKHGFGWKKTRRLFHAHGLRTFFASTVVGTEINGAPIDSLIIEWFLGHTVPETTASYFKNSPATLRNTYSHFVDKLSISEVKTYDLDSKEVLELKKLLKSSQEELKKSEKARLEAENEAQNAKLLAEEANRKIDDFIRTFQE